MRLIAALLVLASAYQVSIEKWRQQREKKLRADDGWLTVTGLFWLKEGANSFGTDPASDIVLPHGPAHAGAFEFHDGKTIVSGQGIRSRDLKPDNSGLPDVLELGDLKLFVIQRGNRYAIRLKDKNSKFRRAFTGLRYFPVNESYRIEARFVVSDGTQKIAIPNILGQTENLASPGYAVFHLHGRDLRLYPVLEDDQLFFIFKDLTSGKETYPAGRFLYSDLPKDGKVLLDFNKAENPPCAFTAYATCPLPPKQNHLPVRVEAGELRYGH